VSLLVVPFGKSASAFREAASRTALGSKATCCWHPCDIHTKQINPRNPTNPVTFSFPRILCTAQPEVISNVFNSGSASRLVQRQNCNSDGSSFRVF
jgi:hypothetical protein